MSPTELGCALSHIKVLKNFLETQEKHALILEDDVFGCDDDIEYIKKFVHENNRLGFVFCGCQDGLMNRYKYGKPINGDVLHIAGSNKGNFSRAAAYVVSQDAARIILNFHYANYITIADFWFDLLDQFNGDMFYISRLSHPVDLKSSNIEAERLAVQRGVAKKFFSRKIVDSILFRAFNEAKRVYFRLRGHVGLKV